MGNGYISYKRRNERTGLENQSWKDSWNSISYADGRLPDFPRATCELQGYAYDAKIRGGPAGPPRLEGRRLRGPAREGGRRPQAPVQPRLLAGRSRLLRPRARRRRQPGRLARLEQRAPAVERHRRRQQGEVRGRPPDGPAACGRAGASGRWPRARVATTRSATTSARCGRSTTRSSPGACGGTASRRRPRGSRPGSSTPPRSSRAGCRRRSAATTASVTKYPVKYPTACSPQAWSTGAPLLLLRTMLGLEPLGDHLVVDPALPIDHRPPRAARHPGSLGPARRLRARPGPRPRGQAPGRGQRRPDGEARHTTTTTSTAPRHGGRHDRWTTAGRRRRVVIVGGGFAGVACARALAKHDDIHVTLIDKNDYHQFQPLLYQVATSMLGAGRHRLSAAQDRRRVRRLRGEARRGRLDRPGREVRHDRQRRDLRGRLPRPRGRLPAELLQDPGRRARVPALLAGRRAGACGPGSSRRSRRRTATPSAPTDGALDFVIVGGGPTGVEVAGALSEMINTTMVHEFPSLAPRAKVHLVDHGQALLKMFADKAHAYSAAGPREGRRGPSAGHGRHRDRPGPREAVRRVDDQDPVRRLGRGPHGGAGRRCQRAAAGSRRSDRREPGLHGRRLPGRARRSATSRTSRRATARPTRSSARSRSRAARRPPRRSSPSARASRPSRSRTSTRGRWR